MKTGDLVRVPPVRTVIRIADLLEPTLRRQMVESFILTGEASFTLYNILNRIASRRGEGFFVIGNYGSGKSHLLNILSLVLSDPEARDTFFAAAMDEPHIDNRLPSAARDASAVNPLVVEISLVEHNNREYLENIVLSRVNEKINAGIESTKTPGWMEMTRPEAFRTLRDLLRRGGWGGLVLLIDELSEFLRSKESVRTYNEDVRFLQFLGEAAENIPAWVVATMQENIENTGALAGELLHKIKDRYPARFHLTGEHVKEIVSGRLVRKTEKAGKALPLIYSEMQRSFDLLPFSLQDFTDLYPVHPCTVELLDELRPLFSQHRGVVDFIHYRLAGDESRNIESLLESEAHHLLTPDYIFDHFRDRIRETMETNPYSDQVYHYYERERNNIFDDDEDSLTALKLLKLLILGALASAPKRFTADELTGLLLYRLSSLESGVNYDYIREIMEKIHAHGAYVVSEDVRGKILYTVDLKANLALLLQKKLAAVTGDLRPGDPEVIKSLLPWLDDAVLPLRDFRGSDMREEEIIWQNTRRRGKLWLGSPGELPRMEELRDELLYGETDFIFCLLPPALEGEQVESFPLLPPGEEDGEDFSRYLIMWIPRDFSAGEDGDLRRAYAYLILQEEYAANESPVGKQIKRQLEGIISEEKRKVKEIFRSLYFQGKIRMPGKTIPPSSFGYLPFAGLMSQVAAEALKELFPRHFEIRPQGEPLTGSLMQRTLELFCSPRVEDEDLERGTRQVIDSQLRPLGLVRKKGKSYFLEINPKTSPLVSGFLSLIPETGRISLNQLYRHIRKGPFGLSGEGFQALGMAAILSGAVSAYLGGKRLSPSQINFHRFWKIEEIGPGTLIKTELQNILKEVPFIPSRLQDAPLTFFTQQQIWEAVTAFKEEWTEKLRHIVQQVDRLKEYRHFSMANRDKLDRIVERFIEFMDRIKVSYSSQEGLEHFLAAFQSRPLIPDDWERLQTLYDFLQGDLPGYLRLGHYLNDPGLHIPAGEKYENLRRVHGRLLELMEDEAFLWDRVYRERIKREFSHFLNEYVSFYLNEHLHALSPNRMKPYHQLMQGKAYRLLGQLSDLNAVAVRDDIVSINRQLAAPLEKECDRAEESLLRERPLCSCGFKLGDRMKLPRIDGLEEQILNGIRSYLEFLHEKGNREALDRYAENLELVGRRREAGPLREIQKVNEGDPELVDRLCLLLAPNIIDHLNRALTGDAIISERSIEKLTEILSGRVFTLNQLEEHFRSWLAGDEEKKPGYIRVTQQKPGYSLNREVLETSGSALQKKFHALLEKNVPHLLPLATRLGIADLLSISLLMAWSRAHGIDHKNGNKDVFEKLIQECLDPAADDWKNFKTDLAGWGQKILSGRDHLDENLLEAISRETAQKVPAARLLELHFIDENPSSFNFETLLGKIIEEPFFPEITREITGKIEGQISSETASNLKVMESSLRQAQVALSREEFDFTPALYQEKKKSLAYLDSLLSCATALNTAAKWSRRPPDSDMEWERFYRHVSPLELMFGRLKEAGEHYYNPEALLKQWTREYATLNEHLIQKFTSYCTQSASPQRQSLHNLLELFPRWTAGQNCPGGAYLAILDGARLDIWNELMEKILEDYRIRPLKTGLLWAEAPTVTGAQLDPLKEAGLLGHIIHMDEPVVTEMLQDPASFFHAIDNRANPAGRRALKALKFNFIDEKLHLSRDPLHILMEELFLQSRKKLWPLLANLPAGALLLLSADHGFKTNPYFSMYKKEDHLYLHGGNSFFEVLTPWALLIKE